jgi:hypothetical protein
MELKGGSRIKGFSKIMKIKYTKNGKKQEESILTSE